MGATTLTLLGGAGTVTGSKYLVEIDAPEGLRRLLVDAGMFQGVKRLRLLNWSDFPVPPASITDVLLTHAHMDHTGYLPHLVKNGFSGAIWGTDTTLALAEIVLRDSAHLQERDADASELIDWVGALRPRPRKVLTVHGEKESAEALAVRLAQELTLEAMPGRANHRIVLTEFLSAE